MKNTNTNINQRKLIDKLLYPPHFGPLLGLLATTYEMQPEFFETDFLPAVLNLGAWDDRSWTSRIEIEKKLAHIESATVFMDASRYRNRPRSLRVKIIPICFGENRIQHSKVVLLLYENAVRLIVGSANLTHQGYRENREVIAVFTASEKNVEQSVFISSALLKIPEILGTWWNPECENLMRKALDLLKTYKSPNYEESEWFVWSGGEDALWQSFVSRWPATDKIQKITIVSPFWSEDVNQEALSMLFNTLNERESLEKGYEVRLLTEAAPDTQTTYSPSLPLSFGNFDFRSLGTVVTAQAVDPKVLKEEVGIEGFIRNRNLHAKVVFFEGKNISLAYLGSANFTKKGWGFLKDPTKANVEAGVVVRRMGKIRHTINDLIPGTAGPIIELSGDAAEKLVMPDPEPDAVPWPRFINELLLTPSSEEEDRLDLQVVIEQKYVKGDWTLNALEDKLDDQEKIIFDSTIQLPHSKSFRVYLTEKQLNSLLKDQEVIVKWWAFNEGHAFPINVDYEARHTLPISPGRHKFNEQHLILYYQGRITWEELFPDPEEPSREQDTLNVFDDDFRGGVDTSKIQSYQIREFIEALKGIVDDLRSACRATEPAMRLALLGPVSPVALARVVADAAHNGAKSPIATGFQIVEIRSCLETAKLYESTERYKKAWSGYINEALEIVDRLMNNLRKKWPDQFKSRSPFTNYERSIRQYYKTAEL